MFPKLSGDTDSGLGVNPDIDRILLLATFDYEEKIRHMKRLKRISPGKNLPRGIVLPSASCELIKLYSSPSYRKNALKRLVHESNRTNRGYSIICKKEIKSGNPYLKESLHLSTALNSNYSSFEEKGTLRNSVLEKYILSLMEHRLAALKIFRFFKYIKARKFYLMQAFKASRARTIQKFIRIIFVRKTSTLNKIKFKSNLVLIQSVCRRHITCKRYLIIKKHATKNLIIIQCAIRIWIAKRAKKYNLQLISSVKIQSLYRCYLSKCALSQLYYLKFVVFVQKNVRRILAKRNVINHKIILLDCTLKLQNFFRNVFCLKRYKIMLVKNHLKVLKSKLTCMAHKVKEEQKLLKLAQKSNAKVHCEDQDMERCVLKEINTQENLLKTFRRKLYTVTFKDIEENKLSEIQDKITSLRKSLTRLKLYFLFVHGVAKDSNTDAFNSKLSKKITRLCREKSVIENTVSSLLDSLATLERKKAYQATLNKVKSRVNIRKQKKIQKIECKSTKLIEEIEQLLKIHEANYWSKYTSEF